MSRCTLAVAAGSVLVLVLIGCTPQPSPSESPSQLPSNSITASPTSPAGQLPSGRVAFDRLRGGFGYEQPWEGSYVLNVTFGEESPVPVDYDVEGLTPTWSPDGTKLLVNMYAPPDVPGRPAILNPDGSDLVILDPGGTAGSLGCTSWSPDGATLACTLDDDAHPDTEGIYTLTMDGAQLTRVTSSPNPSVEGTAGSCGGNDFSPAFSPDGARIAFIRAKCGSGPDPSSDQTATIGVVNADGTGLVEITAPGLVNSHGFSRVRWSPDGARILFGDEHGKLDLVNPDGTAQTPIHLDLPISDYFAYTPDWSPDGAWIIFSLFAEDTTDLYIAGPDGTQASQLLRAPDAEVWASWTATE